MSGGFTPALKRESLGVDGEVAFLASENYTAKRGGITLDASTIPADANGNKIVKRGTLVTPTDPSVPGSKYTVHTGVSDERQTVTVTGSPTGGTFTLTYSGQTTAAIAYNASAAAVQSALTALSNIGDNDVRVSGSNGGPYTVQFQGALADTDVSALTATASLTGGTTPGVTIATASAGGSAGSPTLDPDESGYMLESVNCKDGDVICGIIIHGSVLEARVTPNPDATIRAALKGRITFQG